MRKKGKARIAIPVILVLLVIVAGLFALLRRNVKVYDEETARMGTLETYYSFSGKVITKNAQTLIARGNFTVRDIYVEVDARVSPGDALMRLSSGDILRSDISGEVTSIPISVGNNVSPGMPMMDIVDFTNLQVLIKVDEFDVKAIQAGKEATLTINALGLIEQSKIEHISKQSVSAGDINYYEAKLSAPQDERVLPGMKVDARVLNQRVVDAVLISMKALHFDAYNQPFVYVREGGQKIMAHAVTAGLQDGVSVQILSGLQPGDAVYMPQSQARPMFGRMTR